LRIFSEQGFRGENMEQLTKLTKSIGTSTLLNLGHYLGVRLLGAGEQSRIECQRNRWVLSFIAAFELAAAFFDRNASRPLGSVIGRRHANLSSNRPTDQLKTRWGLFGDLSVGAFPPVLT
jgi:hypothetical protein